MHGERYGPEVAAAVIWAAYTCMRPGEIFAARYSLLEGDEYDLRRQMNSRLGRETEPKHNSTGVIYVPEPAQRAVLDKPPRLHDDLIFHSKRGKQLRQESWHRTWDQVRNAFVSDLPDTHHLRRRLRDDPDDRFDFYELRHFGVSYMLNVLALEPWVARTWCLRRRGARHRDKAEHDQRGNRHGGAQHTGDDSRGRRSSGRSRALPGVRQTPRAAQQPQRTPRFARSSRRVLPRGASCTAAARPSEDLGNRVSHGSGLWMPARVSRRPGDELDELLLGAGETTWAAGPLAKGPGLCHGTAGNGYLIARATIRRARSDHENVCGRRLR
jgi:hypothetical protein